MKQQPPISRDQASFPLIGIDGDDTLWYSEIVYENLYNQVKALFSEQMQWDDITFTHLLHANIRLLGYGMKTYGITLIEYAVNNTSPSSEQLKRVIELTKNTWTEPISLYDNAKSVVEELAASHKLVLLTQGDSSEQASKISRCTIPFGNVEIIPQKNEQSYLDVLRKYNVPPEQFVMIGNSFKSDILPVLNIGAKAIYVKSQWQFERVDDTLVHPNLYRSVDLQASVKIINQLF